LEKIWNIQIKFQTLHRQFKPNSTSFKPKQRKRANFGANVKKKFGMTK